MTYQCAECGASAEIKDGVVIRSCEHDGAVTANMAATVYATGSLAAG